MKRIMLSMLLASALAGGARAAPAGVLFAGDVAAQHRGGHEEHEERGRGRRFERGPPRGRPERHEVRRVPVRRDHDVDRYRYGYVHRPGWRTYGVWYGLYGPLAVYPSLAFLDDALLVGSYVDAAGEVVYIYVLDVDGLQHEYDVTAGGRVLRDVIIGPR